MTCDETEVGVQSATTARRSLKRSRQPSGGLTVRPAGVGGHQEIMGHQGQGRGPEEVKSSDLHPQVLKDLQSCGRLGNVPATTTTTIPDAAAAAASAEEALAVYSNNNNNNLNNISNSNSVSNPNPRAPATASKARKRRRLEIETEFKILKSLIPNIADKQQINELEIIDACVNYIEALQDQLNINHRCDDSPAAADNGGEFDDQVQLGGDAAARAALARVSAADAFRSHVGLQVHRRRVLRRPGGGRTCRSLLMDPAERSRLSSLTILTNNDENENYHLWDDCDEDDEDDDDDGLFDDDEDDEDYEDYDEGNDHHEDQQDHDGEDDADDVIPPPEPIKGKKSSGCSDPSGSFLE